jgi:glycopeptide antibiotics resistance protein
VFPFAFVRSFFPFGFCFLFFLPASFALCFALLCFALLLGVGVRWAMASSGSDRSSGDADAISRAVAEACKAQEWSKGIRLLNKLPDTITSPRLLWYVFYMSVCMLVPMYHHRPSSFIAIQLELASLLPFGWGERMCVETSVVWMESQGVIVVL